MISQVNPHDDELIPLEKIALLAMLSKRNQYLDQGKYLESYGADSMILLLWETLKSDPLRVAPMEFDLVP